MTTAFFPGMMKTTKEVKVLMSAIKVGDVQWFSGYWITITRILEDGRVFGCFPYTPAERDVHMYTRFPQYDHEVTVQVAA